MTLPQIEIEPAVILFDIHIHPFPDKFVHLVVQIGYACPDTFARSMHRFLFQQKGIVEKRVTQELVVFLRNHVDAITAV